MALSLQIYVTVFGYLTAYFLKSRLSSTCSSLEMGKRERERETLVLMRGVAERGSGGSCSHGSLGDRAVTLLSISTLPMATLVRSDCQSGFAKLFCSKLALVHM